MYFDSIQDFWSMGGYGLYVWLSFGIGFLSLCLLWLDSIFAKRKLMSQILTEQARQVRIKAAKQKQAGSSV
ncbi:heme exporter protein CcmD [Paraglaciecola aquimarina]|uniref:Heme exporter protein D n=1 Tax=Paraglaciecola algarum TaxID=3050085 RepID=A0ABS9D7W8_9ALTE|nr:heme exporter protein CcmD [Paraglaciecola sp. G1-23]MCF2948465.1 heme exporter protein CcmD [Paraglaciecola sp. G1-23]